MFNPLAKLLEQSGIDPNLAKQSSFYRSPPPQQMQFNQPNIPIQQSSFQQQPVGSDPLGREIQNIDDKNLKYSMGRTCGTTDCSAFTRDVFKNAYGKDIGGWTGEQQNAGKEVPLDKRQKGDLVFFHTGNRLGPSGLTHVGIDNGDGTFTHFSSTGGGGVKTTPYSQYSFKPMKARRVL